MNKDQREKIKEKKSKNQYQLLGQIERVEYGIKLGKSKWSCCDFHITFFGHMGSNNRTEKITYPLSQKAYDEIGDIIACDLRRELVQLEEKV